jgi:hypothetical protein
MGDNEMTNMEMLQYASPVLIAIGVLVIWIIWDLVKGD